MGLFTTSSISTNSEEDLHANPGVKILDFYVSLLDMNERGITRLDIVRTGVASKRLRSLEAVKQQWVKGWIEGWVGRK